MCIYTSGHRFVGVLKTNFCKSVELNAEIQLNVKCKTIFMFKLEKSFNFEIFTKSSSLFSLN